MNEEKFYNLEDLPFGTIVVLENGFKAMVVRETVSLLENPEGGEEKRNLLFMTPVPTMVWNSNINKPGFRITDLIGKFKGALDEM